MENDSINKIAAFSPAQHSEKPSPHASKFNLAEDDLDKLSEEQPE